MLDTQLTIVFTALVRILTFPFAMVALAWDILSKLLWPLSAFLNQPLWQKLSCGKYC